MTLNITNDMNSIDLNYIMTLAKTTLVIIMLVIKTLVINNTQKSLKFLFSFSARNGARGRGKSVLG